MDADIADGVQRSSRAGRWHADRQLVPDEATGASIALYRSILSNAATDKFTRLSILAKLASLLDLLPAIRAFDLKKSNSTCGVSTYDLALDRAGVYRDLAATQRMVGDIHSSAHMYDRAAALLEALVRKMSVEREVPDGIEDIRTCANDTLLHVLDEWIDVERSLGRNGKSDKLRQRAEKWKTKRGEQ
ncbi:hypothetical protein LPJ53_002520 [Coemansia erecta]|uniref:Uncharacterized protein n=1 Tax=Coemansia erecta TaxID=147472 RepID=A0A9W8CR37_9FUNG|nr:hypothetical protein LPJ53_002520 [Coemansia erecta]